MRPPLRQLLLICLTVAVFGGIFVVAFKVSNGSIAILDPAGHIASEQKRLLMIAFGLMLLVVIPVFVLAFYIAWKYRASNTKATYAPDWEGNTKLELAWWGFPLLIVTILALIAWNTSHSLDPSRSLASTKPPLVIQVVALQWKWLFLYPEQQVASVNFVNIPVDRPIEFQITSDAPMNSFWIPRLGGQIYAMSGMTTKLNLEASQEGSFHGASANISGEGSAHMNFIANATSQTAFDQWVADTRTTGQGELTIAAYTALSRPSITETPTAYADFEDQLFSSVLAKYNSHAHPDRELPSLTVNQLLQIKPQEDR